MSDTWVFERQKWFKVGREDVKGESRSGRPSSSRTEINVERVKQLACSDHWLTVQIIANQLNMEKRPLWKIITEDLSRWKISQDFWIIIRRSTECRCVRILNQTCFVVITGEKTWIFMKNKKPSAKTISLLRRQCKRKKDTQSKVKIILIMFIDIRGIVHSRVLPQSQTINQHVYKEILSSILHSVSAESSGRTNRSCFTTIMHLVTTLW